MALLHFHFPTHPPLLLEYKPSSSHLLTASPHLDHGFRWPISTTLLPQRASETAVRVSLSENQAQALVLPPISDGGGDTPSVQMLSASEVVRSFYGGINRRDLPSIEGLIAKNCVYEDLVFPRPFVGRKDIMAFFNKFIDSISTDLHFVIDDISSEDTSAVGVTWHLGMH